MTAPTTTAAMLDYAVAHALSNYRSLRVHGRQDPYTASRGTRDGAARYLADSVLDHDRPQEFAVEFYRAAKAIHEAVCKRAGVRAGITAVESTRQQLFWQEGRAA